MVYGGFEGKGALVGFAPHERQVDSNRRKLCINYFAILTVSFGTRR